MRKKPEKPEPKKKDAPRVWRVDLSMTVGDDEQVSMSKYARSAKLKVGDIEVSYVNGKVTIQQGRQGYNPYGREPFTGTRLVLDVGDLEPPA